VVKSPRGRPRDLEDARPGIQRCPWLHSAEDESSPPHRQSQIQATQTKHDSLQRHRPGVRVRLFVSMEKQVSTPGPSPGLGPGADRPFDADGQRPPIRARPALVDGGCRYLPVEIAPGAASVSHSLQVAVGRRRVAVTTRPPTGRCSQAGRRLARRLASASSRCLPRVEYVLV